MSVLFTVFVLSFIASIIWPDLFALTVLFVFKPPALVPRAISVVVDTISVCFIIFPIAIVYVTIGVDEAASSICLIIFPVTFVK